MKKLLTCYLLILLTGCSSSLLRQPITLTNDNYQTLCNPLILKKQQELLVRLPSSNITGYKWQLENNASPILLLKTHKIQKDETPENRLHREETLWKFTAVQTGNASLSFIYQLEWDTNIADDQRVECNIKVIEN